MPFKYIVLSVTLEAYYSDFFRDALEDQVGFDPKDPANVAYTQYNKPYATFQYYGGFGLQMPINGSRAPINSLLSAPQPGDIWRVDIQNITTNSPSAVFNYVYTVAAGNVPQRLRAVVSMPAMSVLGPGDIEINSSFTSISTSTVYGFLPKQITLVAP